MFTYKWEESCTGHKINKGSQIVLPSVNKYSANLKEDQKTFMAPGISILERLSSHLIHNFSQVSNIDFFIGNAKFKKLATNEGSENTLNK